MKRCQLIFLVACIIVLACNGCAELPEEYSTEPDPKYTITYLLTEFESGTHKNAEGIIRDAPPMGYHYSFGDPKSLDDYIEPYPKESEYCRTQTLQELYAMLDTDTDALIKAIQKGDTDAELDPAPKKCSVATGLQTHSKNPFPHFDSKVSFRMQGRTGGEGVGFGTYFSDYKFVTVTEPDSKGTKLRRDANGNLPAVFSDGRLNSDGEPICSDDEMFAGVVDDGFESEDRDVFTNEHKNDLKGKYTVTGPVYTAGKVWEDTDGKVHYELDYVHKDKLKEPRCLMDMGQEGFVMWAMGDATIEVALNMQETAPLTDGGMCDEDAGEKCYDFHHVRFELDGAWREYHAAWSDFVQYGWGTAVALNPNRIINIQVKVVPPENEPSKPFDVWLDHIGFYGGKTWEFVDLISDTSDFVTDTESDEQTENAEEEE